MVATAAILSLSDRSSSYSTLKELGSSQASATASANWAAPAPPSEKWVVTAQRRRTRGDFADCGQIRVVVAREGVDGHHRGHPVGLHVGQLLRRLSPPRALIGVLSQQRLGQGTSGTMRWLRNGH